MHSCPEISTYFITYGSVSEPTLDGDILVIPGTESYYEITKKTIDSIEYFLAQESYDFVIRTNISSIWNFQRTLDFLGTLPRTGVYCGTPIHDFWNVPHIAAETVIVNWVSGSGIVFTPDVCQKLIEHRNSAIDFRVVDDVDFGYALQCVGVTITPGSRHDIYDDTLEIPSGFYHYRVRLLPQPPDVINRTITCMERVKCLMQAS